MLNQPVLVLNKLWVAIKTIKLKKAFQMVFKNRAMIVDPTQDFKTFTWDDWSALRPKEGEESIASVNFLFRIPRCIVLTKYSKIPQSYVNFSRKNLFRRDNNQCQYCGIKPGTEGLNIDHIIPRSLGGKTNWQNCVVACFNCNIKKSNRTPEEAGMKLLKRPERPKFKSLHESGWSIKSFAQLLGDAYWLTELEHD